MMTRMRVHVFVLALLAVCSLATSRASGDPVDDYVRAVMAARKIPGVSLAILRDGRVIKSEGYGFADLEHEAPATPDTIYQSGSVGKQFTAAVMLLLAEDGRLGLDDRLAKHFPDGPSSWHRITIRHLLTHTSGLKDYGSDEVDYRRDYTDEELLTIVQRMPLEFEPGTQWSYSNTGYLLLGLLTSRLTGAHWSDVQAERLFRPLGMTTTRVISERDLVRHRASGYELDEAGELKNQRWVAPSLNRCADGALYFSVKDLAAWEAALQARTFLRPESFDAWWTPVALSADSTYPYGFGWAIAEQRGHRLVEHGGSWQGFRAAIARYVDHALTVVVLTNLAQASPEAMAHAIAGLVEPGLRMPDATAAPVDPQPERTERLRSVLEAWADFRPSPSMGRGLAATHAGSAREASARRSVARRLAALRAFRYLGEDDLSGRPIDRRGERVTTIAYYILETAEARHLYRFLLSDRGAVIDFDAEEP
jgi:CubicO group peptidase (beta-lactamase class C family)